MKDALRLGEITAKQHLALKKKETEAERDSASEAAEAASILTGELMCACIVKAVKNSKELSDLVRLVNKFGELTGADKWSVARLLEMQICVCGFDASGDTEWFVFAPSGIKRSLRSRNTAVMRAMITAVRGSKLRFYFADGDIISSACDDGDPRPIYMSAEVTDALASSVKKLASALEKFDQLKVQLQKIESMEEELPNTLETIEGNILRERLNSENGGGLAVRAVENAIVAHLSGDVTALLLPTHNLTSK